MAVLRSAFAGDGHTGALSDGLVVLGPHELGRLADLAGLQGQEDVSGLLVHAGHDLFGAWKTRNTKPSLLRNRNIQIYRTSYGLLKICQMLQMNEGEKKKPAQKEMHSVHWSSERRISVHFNQKCFGYITVFRQQPSRMKPADWLLPGRALAQTGSDTWEGFPTPLSLTARTLNT